MTWSDVYNGSSKTISSLAKGLEIGPGFRPAHRKPMLGRRSLLKGSLLSGSAFFFHFAGVAWPSSLRSQQKDPTRNGKLLDYQDYIQDGQGPLEITQCHYV